MCTRHQNGNGRIPADFSNYHSNGHSISQLNASARTPYATQASQISNPSGVQSLVRRVWDKANDGTISALFDALRHGDGIDDRKMLLEHVLEFMSKTPPGKLQDTMQRFVTKGLYRDLSHPPATWIGPQYAWRAADGGYNNPDFPDLGRAGTSYARSVQQTNPLPRNQLPDAGLLFDTLLKRDKFRPHPAGLSSLMFSWAALVVHSIFRTDHQDVSKNMTSGYVDLALLYGNDQEMQDKVRCKEGRGMLYPDVFAEDRLLLLPPATCALLVLFGRNHNYIAKRILEVNERGTWVDPSTLEPNSERLLRQDDEIFQIARLCNCAWFANVIFADYVSAILGMNRQGSNWSLSPFGEFRELDHQLFERGRGNAVSVEFNCLYRWHATTSEEDEKWVEEKIGELFPGSNPNSVTQKDFKDLSGKLGAMVPDLKEWTFGGIKRQANGYFRDEDLARIIKDAISHHAGAFGARSTPASLRLIEIMGIEANRQWGVCSLNDFRKYLGLKTYTSFEEWNPDPSIASAARKLYGHIDHLELYVGLQAEETKPVIEAAGLCPGYTISRAILSDAIALTRGDRFFTQDYTPWNMTSWGFADCQRQEEGPGFGSMLGRLILRHLPDQFAKDSIYAWFPLMQPDSMEGYLAKMKMEGVYSVERPVERPAPIAVEYRDEVERVLMDEDHFASNAVEKAASVIKGEGFFTASAYGVKKAQSSFLSALVSTPKDSATIGQYFFDKTQELIKLNSWELVGEQTRGVDIVKHVLKAVPIHWAANEIAGIPLKADDKDEGAYTAEELYDILGEIYEFIFLEVEPSQYMTVQKRVKENINALQAHITRGLMNTGSRLSLSYVCALFGSTKKTFSSDFFARLFDVEYSPEEACNAVLALMVGATVELSLALTNVLNTFLGEEAATISTLSQNEKELTGRIFEALRLDPPFRGVLRTATSDTTIGSLHIAQGERLFLDTQAAGLSGPAYIASDGLFRTVGTDLACTIIAEVIRAVYAFDETNSNDNSSSVARGPGQSGRLARFKTDADPCLNWAYLDAKQSVSPWPRSLVIQYE